MFGSESKFKKDLVSLKGEIATLRGKVSEYRKQQLTLTHDLIRVIVMAELRPLELDFREMRNYVIWRLPQFKTKDIIFEIRIVAEPWSLHFSAITLFEVDDKLSRAFQDFMQAASRMQILTHWDNEYETKPEGYVSHYHMGRSGGISFGIRLRSPDALSFEDLHEVGRVLLSKYINPLLTRTMALSRAIDAFVDSGGKVDAALEELRKKC